jgi:hypothetical protein
VIRTVEWARALSGGHLVQRRVSGKMVLQQIISMLRNRALHLSRRFNHPGGALSRKNKNGRSWRPFR